MSKFKMEEAVHQIIYTSIILFNSVFDEFCPHDPWDSL